VIGQEDEVLREQPLLGRVERQVALDLEEIREEAALALPVLCRAHEHALVHEMESAPELGLAHRAVVLAHHRFMPVSPVVGPRSEHERAALAEGHDVRTIGATLSRKTSPGPRASRLSHLPSAIRQFRAIAHFGTFRSCCVCWKTPPSRATSRIGDRNAE
jgi:hypothetical protein